MLLIEPDSIFCLVERRPQVQTAKRLAEVEIPVAAGMRMFGAGMKPSYITKTRARITELKSSGHAIVVVQVRDLFLRCAGMSENKDDQPDRHASPRLLPR